MVIWVRWHCPLDTGFKILALAVWGRARHLSVSEALHNTDFFRAIATIICKKQREIISTHSLLSQTERLFEKPFFPRLLLFRVSVDNPRGCSLVHTVRPPPPPQQCQSAPCAGNKTGPRVRHGWALRCHSCKGEPRDRHDSDITLLEVMPSAWATVKAAAGSAVTSSDHRKKIDASIRINCDVDATLLQCFVLNRK